jgi:hypothetical protein
MRLRLLAALVAAAAALSCRVILVGDMEVNWSLDASCATYGVDQWEVSAVGPELVRATFGCKSDSGRTYGSGTRFYSIAEGYYEVSVRALSVGGQVLATRTHPGRVPVVSDRVGVTIVGPSDLDFRAADFGATLPSCGNGVCDDAKGETCSSCAKDCGACAVCGNGACEDTKGETCSSCAKDCGSCAAKLMLDLFWNINGTVDGTPKSKSWDECAEVGAASVAVSLDGKVSYLVCAANNMAGSLEVSEGAHSIKVWLVDSLKNAITTETPAVSKSCKKGEKCELVADFYWDSFVALKNTQKGDYLFETSWAGGGCKSGQVSLALLKVDKPPQSDPVVADVCGPDSVCFKSDGVLTGKCWGAGSTQKIKDQIWGSYKLRVKGAMVDTGGNPQVCWDMGEQYADILIGAGNVNPIVKHNVPRVSSSGVCAP